MTAITSEITVAAISEQNGRFLFIEERSSGRIVLTQPAGHLEPDETLAQAVVRETLEESGCHFEPSALGGIYVWKHPRTGVTIVRVNFIGAVTGRDADRELDDGVIRMLWLEHRQVVAQRHRLRSPMVERGLDDYLAGKRYPLSVLQSVEGGWLPRSQTG